MLHSRSFRDVLTDTAEDITPPSEAVRAVIYARDFCVPTVAVNVAAEILYPAADGEDLK